MKKRIDRLLVERGLAETRQKAQALIMAGSVLVEDQPVTKPGSAVDEDVNIRLKQQVQPYVSRGGVKLEGAARHFAFEISGKVCLDVGVSTGGFTHYLILNGAARIYAVDVDIRQVDWKLGNDPRVILIQMNARYLEPAHIGEPVDLVTMDAAFISATKILSQIPPLLKTGGYCLCLVKPQFEVGRDKVGKGGIVRDSKHQREAVENVIRAGVEAGFVSRGDCESPITGMEGNREFFVLFEKS